MVEGELRVSCVDDLLFRWNDGYGGRVVEISGSPQTCY